ncbi:hypothetical protein [Dyadobacter sediminis]|uniref:Uncharacterized protein n=1 Tax=Dyadobacter sediminis TaxID=1493691 RepID=A0A5R9KBK5_9BACT|nr:hypothetical protein [Dyadobacter sediminis]TLU92097.1 hypothetical protein FEM55_15215 [Dyadobacter sediminis]GGB97463.1 hypothetical protein GCM10011325_25990 [Dyadobacter sediminis]
MKPYLLLALFSILPACCSAQIFVGDVDINRADSIKIVEVYINRRVLRNMVNVYVDYGQKDNFNAQSLGYRTDNLIIMQPETKKKMVFKSTAAVLNFFERNHWEYLDGFAENAAADSGYYYYFKKRQ